MIDFYTRKVVGHCTGNDVKDAMMKAFDHRGLENISGVRMESVKEHSSYATPLRISSQ
jgi:hypothetical protein